MDVVVKAEWDEVVLSPSTENSPAVIDKTVGHAFVQVVGSEGFTLPGAGKKFRLKVSPNGFIDVYKEKDEHFPLGEYFVILPEHKVRKGDVWQNDLAVLPLPNAVSRRILSTRMSLDGFEYVAGKRCARITTTFKEDNVSVRVKLGQNVFPLKTSYEAERVSFFGIDVGHFVAFEERMKHTIELPVQIVQMLYQFQLGPQGQQVAGMYGAGAMPGGMAEMPGGMPGMMPGAMGPEAGMMGAPPAAMPGMGPMPGMAGMPGAPGMPGAGMEGGMAAYGGAPGMYGGGMPGMDMGMGGMGATQMKPAKVIVESQLRIIENTPAKT
jgi:hypothetical protein